MLPRDSDSSLGVRLPNKLSKKVSFVSIHYSILIIFETARMSTVLLLFVLIVNFVECVERLFYCFAVRRPSLGYQFVTC